MIATNQPRRPAPRRAETLLFAYSGEELEIRAYEASGDVRIELRGQAGLTDCAALEWACIRLAARCPRRALLDGRRLRGTSALAQGILSGFQRTVTLQGGAALGVGATPFRATGAA